MLMLEEEQKVYLAQNYRLGHILSSGKYHRTHYAIDRASEQEVIIRIVNQSALDEAVSSFENNKLVS